MELQWQIKLNLDRYYTYIVVCYLWCENFKFMRLSILTKQFERQATEDLQLRLLELANQSGKKTKRVRGAIKRVLKKRDGNGSAKNNNVQSTRDSEFVPDIPDINLKQAKRGDAVKKIANENGSGFFVIVKGDPTNWNDAYSEFVIKNPRGMERYADTYTRACEIVWEINEYDINW